MDLKLLALISILCLGVAYWVYADFDRGLMNYRVHKTLFNAETQTFKRARDVMNMKEIILAPEEYIDRTNSLERLNHVIQAMNFEAPYMTDQYYSEKEDVKLAVGPNVNLTRCGQHLDWLRDQLKGSNSSAVDLRRDPDHGFELLTGKRGMELATLVDTFGKPDSGFYSGNTFWPGSYKLCTSLQMQFDDAAPSASQALGMHYCIARYRHKGWANIRDASYPEASVRLGICLPETCDTSSFPDHQRQIDFLAKLEMSEHFKESLRLMSLTCLPDERSPLRQIPASGCIYLAILLGWSVLIITLTLIYEFHIRPNHLKRGAQMSRETYEEFAANQAKKDPKLLEINHKLELNNDAHQVEARNNKNPADNCWLEIIEALSVRHSLKSFKLNTFRVRHHRGERVRVNLSPLDSVKITMALLIILGHSSLISIIYARSLKYKIDLLTGNAGQMAMSTVRCVDTYFVFFGVLTSFTLLRKFRPQQLANPIFWIGINLGIFLRVGPIFMLAYWFARSISPYLSSGPWWDYGFNEVSMRGMCLREPWWKSIPYFGNAGIPAVPTCLLPGWFIVCYVQLSLMMPLITYILANLNSNLKRISLVCFLSTLSCAAVAIRVHQQTAVVPEGISLFGSMAFNLIEKYEPSGYLTSLGRLGSVTVGSFVGFLLHAYDTELIKEWPSWIRGSFIFWTSLLGMVGIVVLPLIGHQLYLTTGLLPTLNGVVVANFLTGFAFPIFVAILLINVATTNNRNVIIRFLGHSFWHIFNRLGLLIFLIHWEILMFGATSFESAPSYGFITDVMKMWAFGSFGSILIAFVLYIMIEAPLSCLLIKLAQPWLGSSGSRNDNNNKNRFETRENESRKIQNVVTN